MNAETSEPAVTLPAASAPLASTAAFARTSSSLALIAAGHAGKRCGRLHHESLLRCARCNCRRSIWPAGVCRAILVTPATPTPQRASRETLPRCAAPRRWAQRLRCPVTEIAVASTGKIGIPLPADKICAGLDTLIARLSVTGGADAAQAILTTDTFAKERAA